MDPETIVVIVVAVIVMTLFGVFRRKKNDDNTRIIIVDSAKDVRTDTGSRGGSRGPSGFAQAVMTVISLAGGFFIGGVVIMEVLVPEVGYVDPWEIGSIVIYLVIALVIYGILRLFVRG